MPFYLRVFDASTENSNNFIRSLNKISKLKNFDTLLKFLNIDSDINDLKNSKYKENINDFKIVIGISSYESQQNKENFGSWINKILKISINETETEKIFEMLLFSEQISNHKELAKNINELINEAASCIETVEKLTTKLYFPGKIIEMYKKNILDSESNQFKKVIFLINLFKIEI